jgi:di- and tripeptidase
MLLGDGAIAERPGEQVLITGGGDGSIKVWSLAGRPSELFKLGDDGGSQDSVLSIALDENFVIAGRMGGQIDIWDFETRAVVRSLRSSLEDVCSLSVGPSFLFACGSNGMIEASFKRYMDETNLSRDSMHNMRSRWFSRHTTIVSWHRHSA